ncbi:hypothetical protein Y032_0518g2818 [Ancylostoma ceylanicum]|uniref:Galactosylgalactosylxylosylprotein 3-beta-glucuronosyltransferase n=2 Tax=Ancylostoma ceylanicum TaxID=53326 RepID=A0A016WSZ6_9BILA|nr:hypothetical protein Y032_0518g2818 [Ancylostoma ceylanicum]
MVIESVDQRPAECGRNCAFNEKKPRLAITMNSNHGQEVLWWFFRGRMRSSAFRRPHTLSLPLPSPFHTGRGWTHRNLALQYIRENYNPDIDAVLYFADDDNSYDLRLFENYIRQVKRLGIWPVGLVGGAWVEAPKVGKNGKVEAWDVVFAPKREFATDMAGFALHVKELFRVMNASFDTKCAKTAGYGPESCFLTQFGFKKKDAEPFGHNDVPKDILVWHTKTSASRGTGPFRGFIIE